MDKFENPDLLFKGGYTIEYKNRSVNYSVWITRLEKIKGPYSKIAEWATIYCAGELQKIEKFELNDGGVFRLNHAIWNTFSNFIATGVPDRTPFWTPSDG